MPHFAKGADKAEAAAKAQSGSRADFLAIKSGERVILRPLTDLEDLIPVDMHMGVPTKKRPKKISAEKWPEQMSAVCRNADAFRVRDANDQPTDVWEEDEKGRPYGDCYVHEHMQDVMGKYKKSVARTTSQTWGLFVMRREVRDENKKLKGYEDIMEEFKDEAGRIHPIPKIVIASQSWTNFWAPFNSAGDTYGTICDHDFAVERTDNEYTTTVGREMVGHKPGSPSWQKYLDAMELKGISIEKILVEQASYERYGRFFDPDYKEEENEDDDDAAAEAGDASLSDEEAAELKAKMAKSFAGTQPT